MFIVGIKCRHYKRIFGLLNLEILLENYLEITRKTVIDLV